MSRNITHRQSVHQSLVLPSVTSEYYLKVFERPNLLQYSTH